MNRFVQCGWLSIWACSMACSDDVTYIPGDVIRVHTDAGDARVKAQVREVCNGIDDDDDRKVDEGCPVRLTNDPADDVFPQMDGSRVIWRRSSATGEGYDLYYRDLSAGGEERRLAERVYTATISGHRIAYGPIDASGLVLLDLATMQTISVKSGKSPYLQVIWSPMLQGDWLVWTEYRPPSEFWGDDSAVMAYSIATGELREVAFRPPFMHRNARLDGTRIIWSDDRFGHHIPHAGFHRMDFFVRDLAKPDEPERRLTVQPEGGQISLAQAIDGGRVIAYEVLFQFDPAGTATTQPVMFDIATGARQELGPPQTGIWPFQDWRQDNRMALSGSRWIRTQDPSDSADLSMVDLTTGEQTWLTKHARQSRMPSLDGDRVVWQDDRNDQWELYTMDLSDIDEGDFSPEWRTP